MTGCAPAAQDQPEGRYPSGGFAESRRLRGPGPCTPIQRGWAAGRSSARVVCAGPGEVPAAAVGGVPPPAADACMDPDSAPADNDCPLAGTSGAPKSRPGTHRDCGRDWRPHGDRAPERTRRVRASFARTGSAQCRRGRDSRALGRDRSGRPGTDPSGPIRAERERISVGRGEW